MDIRLRARERRIAEEIARELHRALGPHAPEALAENSDVVCGIFSAAFDEHRVVSESSGARILAYVPAELARLNQSFADLNLKLDAAIRSRSRGSFAILGRTRLFPSNGGTKKEIV